MPTRNAEATWDGDLKGGSGTLKLGSGAFEGSYSFSSRFEDGEPTNPEELLGAAHAGCFSMALSADLGRDGYEPDHIHTDAHVHLEKVDDEFSITKIELETEGSVPDIDEETFKEYAESAKETCIVSRALAVPEVTLTATLTS